MTNVQFLMLILIKLESSCIILVFNSQNQVIRSWLPVSSNIYDKYCMYIIWLINVHPLCDNQIDLDHVALKNIGHLQMWAYDSYSYSTKELLFDCFNCWNICVPSHDNISSYNLFGGVPGTKQLTYWTAILSYLPTPPLRQDMTQG